MPKKTEPPVSPIATIKPRTVVATIPCPRPGCGGTITMTAGDKGASWGTCKKITPHVGKTGRANVCGTPVSFTPLQTRALLEGRSSHETPPASPPPPPSAEKPASSSGGRAAGGKPRADARQRDKRFGAERLRDTPAGNDPAGGPKPAKRRIGFFEF